MEIKFSTPLLAIPSKASSIFEQEVTEEKADNNIIHDNQPLTFITQKRPSNSDISSSVSKKVKHEKTKQLFEEVEDEVRDYWIVPGIIVKLLNKNIGNGQFYGKKGIVTQCIDLYVAVVKIIENGIIMKIDQSQLETVIPAIESPVAIVNGKYRGRNGILKNVDFDKFKTIVEIDGKEIEKEYEQICKLNIVT